jgi:hypothetical protein
MRAHFIHWLDLKPDYTVALSSKIQKYATGQVTV